MSVAHRRLVGLALIGVCLVAGQGTVLAQAVVGKAAPAFDLPGHEGRVTLDARRGKIVLVDFWATWCAPCKEELPKLDAMAQEFAVKKLPIEIIVISVDTDPEAAKKFLADRKLTHVTAAFDTQGKAAELYEPPSMPTSYVVDEQGIVRTVHKGYRKGDEKKVRAELVERAASAAGSKRKAKPGPAPAKKPAPKPKS